MPCNARTNELLECVTSCKSSVQPRPRKSKADDAWTSEARKTLFSICSLYLFLKSIRRAYLDTSTHPRNKLRYDSASAAQEESPFSMWTKLKYLTDYERDEIEVTVKGMLRQLMHTIDTLKDLDQSKFIRAVLAKADS